MKLSNIAHNWDRSKKNTYVMGGNDFDGFLRLDIGEPWFPLTPDLENTINKLSVDDFKKRPDIQFLKLRSGASKFWNVPAENIAVANGSDQIIWLLPRLFMNPGDNAIVINPTFFLFSESVKRAGGKILSLTTLSDSDFAITDQLVSDIISLSNENSARIIWLCNPNNPTGKSVSLEKVRRIAKNTTALVVVDEAFFDISDLPSTESAKTIIKNHKNILVLKTLSKTFGLNNVRVGFALASKELIHTLEGWQLPFEVSNISQEIGSVILGDITHWEKMKRTILNERQWLINKIGATEDIELIPTTTTIFIMRHKNKNLFNMLLNQKILAADFNNCKGIENLGFVRVSVQNRVNNERLINALNS